MYTVIMENYESEVKRIAHRMCGEKRHYWMQSRDYMKDVMLHLSQEELIVELEKLNYKELKQCIASGIPGHAMYIAHDLSRKKKAEIAAFIEKQGSEATMKIEIENPPEDDKDGDRPFIRSGNKYYN